MIYDIELRDGIDFTLRDGIKVYVKDIAGFVKKENLSEDEARQVIKELREKNIDYCYQCTEWDETIIDEYKVPDHVQTASCEGFFNE